MCDSMAGIENVIEKSKMLVQMNSGINCLVTCQGEEITAPSFYPYLDSCGKEKNGSCNAQKCARKDKSKCTMRDKMENGTRAFLNSAMKDRQYSAIPATFIFLPLKRSTRSIKKWMKRAEKYSLCNHSYSFSHPELSAEVSHCFWSLVFCYHSFQIWQSSSEILSLMSE